MQKAARGAAIVYLNSVSCSCFKFNCLSTILEETLRTLPLRLNFGGILKSYCESVTYFECSVKDACRDLSPSRARIPSSDKDLQHFRDLPRPAQFNAFQRLVGLSYSPPHKKYETRTMIL